MTPATVLTGNPAFWNEGPGVSRPVLTDEFGGVYRSKLAPRYMAYARMGWVRFATHTVATAVAPLQVVPTTTAAFVLNNVSVTGNMAVMLEAGCMFASGTAPAGFSLWGQVTSAPLATQLTQDAVGITRGNGRGGAGQVGDTFADFSKTVAGGWALLGAMDTGVPATPGVGLTRPLDGGWIVKPTYAFGLHVVAGAGSSAAFTFYAKWIELPITLQ